MGRPPDPRNTNNRIVFELDSQTRSWFEEACRRERPRVKDADRTIGRDYHFVDSTFAGYPLQIPKGAVVRLAKEAKEKVTQLLKETRPRKPRLKTMEKEFVGCIQLVDKDSPPKLGDPVYILYRDHVHFENSDPGQFKALPLEAVGWLEHEDEESLRIVLDRIQNHRPVDNVRIKTSGLVILKKTIVALRRL